MQLRALIKESQQPSAKLVSLINDFRQKQEDYWDWEDDPTCFKGTCHHISADLASTLQKHGFQAEAYHGNYYNIDDDFEPLESEGSGPYDSWRHWWVVVDKQWIVDVTSDQFHPGEEEDYRVVIVPVGHSDYSKPR